MIGSSDQLCWLAGAYKIPSLEAVWIYGLQSKYAVPSVCEPNEVWPQVEALNRQPKPNRIETDCRRKP